jgi:chromate transporter
VLDSRLVALILTFAPLSLVAFGGGQAIVADIQQQTVSIHGWLTGQEFTDIFAISRAAPGPSTLMVALIGWHVAGFWGALVGILAIFIPSSVLVYGLGTWWLRHRGSTWTIAIERGLAPVAVGLIFAGALAVMQTAHVDALRLATVLAATLVLYFTKLGPYPLLGMVGAVYLLLYFVFF